jgi:hypothetical protein
MLKAYAHNSRVKFRDVNILAIQDFGSLSDERLCRA